MLVKHYFIVWNCLCCELCFIFSGPLLLFFQRSSQFSVHYIYHFLCSYCWAVQTAGYIIWQGVSCTSSVTSIFIMALTLCEANGSRNPTTSWPFQSGTSTYDQIMSICHIIEKFRELSHSLIMCFIDYAKSIWYHLTLLSLEDACCHEDSRGTYWTFCSGS